MSKIVKYNEFKKVIDALWSKSTEVFSYFEKDKASLNKNNTFTGKNTFNEVNLIGKKAFVESSGNVQSTGHKNNIYCGNREVSTHKNIQSQGIQYVSAIKIRILDTVNIGDSVSGICVTAIEKRTDRTDDIVGKTIVYNDTFIVEEDTKYGKCIYVPIQKEYANDTYFLIGQKGSKRELREYHFSNTTVCINNLNIDRLPQEGSPLNHNEGNGWLIIHSLISDKINVREKLESINNNIDGKVDRTEVGNEAGKIPIVNSNGKLEESIMPDIAITDIIVIARGSDLMNQNVQTGDVVVVQDEGNKTYMCKNPNGQTQDTRFIEINMGYPVVKEINGERPTNTGAITIDGTQINVDSQSNTSIKDEFEKCVMSVNNQTPTLQGNVTITARQINAVVGVQSPKSVNDHLNDLNTLTINHTNQINTVINRRSAHIGQIINTFNDRGAEFTENGATFIYIGGQKRVTPADYPELARIFNKQAAASYLLPIVSDSVINFDGTSRTSIKHYICAKLV